MVKKVENRASWERRPLAVDRKKGRLSGDMFIANKFLLLSVTPSIGISTVRGAGRPEADLPRGEDTDPSGWAANLAKRRRRECISVMFKSTAEAVDKNGLRCDCLLCVFIYKLIVLVMRPRHCY